MALGSVWWNSNHATLLFFLACKRFFAGFFVCTLFNRFFITDHNSPFIMTQSVFKIVVASLLLAFLVVLGIHGWGTMPAMGALLDPVDGVYRLARTANDIEVDVQGAKGLTGRVIIERDERGVPYIFASQDLDAAWAVGFLTAKDRLFQMDFLPRVASGRLSEVLGEAFLNRDRFLRSTGMYWGAEQNLSWLKTHYPESIRQMEAFCGGVNHYLDQLSSSDLPLEFRLLGYQPEPCTPLRTLLVLQYMNFDLSWRSDELGYAFLRQQLGEEAFNRFFPQLSTAYSPISPETSGNVPPVAAPLASFQARSLVGIEQLQKEVAALLPDFGHPDTGSNNFAVDGSRSTTGQPILAGDPHLSLTLPAIWYEIHVKTPRIHSHGVAVPGTPLPIIGFNDDIAWTPTNTDIDQIDFYKLTLSSDGKKYRYLNEWRPIMEKQTIILVKGGSTYTQTLRYTHWGPIVFNQDYPSDAIAVQWTAHKPSRTSIAVWEVNKARNLEEFEQAMQHFDTPMQNWLYADRMGNIGIRSTGHMPIRRVAYAGGLLDGSSDAGDWIGRVPYADLPSGRNPKRGWLMSANQQPAPNGYAYYQRITWRDAYRSLRIDSLLSGKAKHSVKDIQMYQSDVKSLQHQYLLPFLTQAYNGKAEQLRKKILAWDGVTRTNQAEPLILDLVISSLKKLTWDEFDVLEAKFKQGSTNPETKKSKEELLKRPELTPLFEMLRNDTSSGWFDRKSTPQREDGTTILRMAFEAAADSLIAGYNQSLDQIPLWGEEHQVMIPHILSTLTSLGRGPYPFPGFEHTVSPARGRLVKNSASWRMVVDFSGKVPVGYGVFPGGSSGNPFSHDYDRQIPEYLRFSYYILHRPSAPGALQKIRSRMTIHPS